MALFEIHVQYSDGSPASGVRVVLSSSALLGGMSKPEWTDSHGRAVVELSTAASGTLYVDGRDRGTVRAGRSVVTLR